MVSIDFTKKWELADVALKVNDSETLLHVNKSVLAVHSSYFKTLFFGGFAESKQEVVVVDLPNWTMLEILRIAHNVERFSQTGCRLRYSIDEVIKLYRAADFYDIPLIRQLCNQNFLRLPVTDAFDVSIQLGQQKAKSEVLKKMSFKDVEAYLSKGGTDLVFSSTDVAMMLWKCKEQMGRSPCPKCKSVEVNLHQERVNAFDKFYVFVCKKCQCQFEKMQIRVK